MMEQYRRRGFGSVAVGLVAALAGVLFATNASLFADDTSRTPTDLVDLARVETARLAENEAEVAELRRRRDELVAARQPMPEVDPEESELTALAAGRTPVTGPGVVVELRDAPEQIGRASCRDR